MVQFDQGINIYRDKINIENNKGELGDDGSPKTTTDTDINSAIASTEFITTNTVFFRGVKVSYSPPTGTGSGSTAREFVMRNVAGTALGGFAFPDEEIDVADDIEIDAQIILLQEFE